MAAMDEFREQREAIKHAPFKEKAAYVWDYYKWFIIVGVLVLVGVTSYIYSIATKKDVLLNGILLNVFQTEADSTGVVNDFYKLQNIDTKKEEISLNSSLFYSKDSTQSYQTLQVLMTWVSAEQVDFISCSDVETMTDLAYRGYFANLSETLNPVDYEKYKDLFYYMDEDIYIRRRESANSGEEIDAIKIPDPTKPDEMKKPIPVFIRITDSEPMQKAYGTHDEDLVFGISSNAPNMDMTLRFLEYIMK